MTVRQLLAADGPLADTLEGFSPRPAQQELADAVEQALASGDTLVAEAGTGIGKSIAYLVPVLRSGLRTVISTATRHLQDQLYLRDLPVACRALGFHEPVALLKGRANYLCKYRLAQTRGGEARLTATALAEFNEIEYWSRRTETGDIAEVSEVSEGSSIWPRVTSTVENCLGVECDYYSDCHVLQARRKAQSARVVVVNHHLLFADMALKEEGFGEVLPEAEAFVLDEAHQLAEIASGFFGQQLSSRQLLGLAQDSRIEQLRDAADATAIGEQAARLEKATRDFRLAFPRGSRRDTWARVAGEVMHELEQVIDTLHALNAELEAAAERGKGLEQCYRRSTDLLGGLRAFGDVETGVDVCWFETYSQGFALHRTPLDVAPLFRGFLERWQTPWIFTSATLTVASSFAHFRTRLGLDDARELLLGSPFDYERNALLYLPQGLPDPGPESYSDAVREVIRPVIMASGGRAFVLVTSHAALRYLSETFTDLPFPVLVQGAAPKRELLEQFRELGNAVLFGTASFWEGVDVRGSSLSCVIIDKLPFASPGDPVLQARLEALREQGGEPFRDYQLPQAVIALKQGAGRLIRDVTDRGVLVLCDPRIRRRSYGRLFLESLPPLPVTDELAEVETFFAAEHDQAMPAPV